MRDVLNEVISELQPSTHRAEYVLSRIEEAIEEQGIEAQPVLGGSVSKDTHVGDDYDVDIFTAFPKTVPERALSQRLKALLESAEFDYQQIRGSRDYYVVTLDRRYELIPVYDIDTPDQAHSIVDISTLHVNYFNQRANEEIRRGVRLLKQFMKAHHVYGAESHIGGFSGHVVDLLILAYESFPAVLEAATTWTPKTVIDIEEHQEKPLRDLNESKTQGPLILVDPIQAERNAAAAVRQKAYDEFKQAAQDFLRNPSRDHFRQPSLAERVQRAETKAADDEQVIRVDVSFDDDERSDISGDKLVKIEDHLRRRLVDENFAVGDSFTHHGDTSAVVITTSQKPKSRYKTVQGPPVGKEEHAARFKAKHDDVKNSDDRLIAKEPTTYDKATEAVHNILDEPYVTARCMAVEPST